MKTPEPREREYLLMLHSMTLDRIKGDISQRTYVETLKTAADQIDRFCELSTPNAKDAEDV